MMKLDGSEKQKIGEYIGSINVVGDWIYYSTERDSPSGDGLYKMKTDGSGKQKLAPGLCEDICVFDNWVYFREYYWDDDHGNSIYFFAI